MTDSVQDFSRYMSAKETTARYRAQREAASAGLDLAQMRERCAEVISQHEPLNTLGLNRDAVRRLVLFIQCGRLDV